MSNKSMSEIMKHFPRDYSKKLQDFVTNVVLLSSRYLFTYRKGKRQYAYCTHCRSDFLSQGMKHNASAVCPKCKSNCRVQASGLSRKYMYDTAYVVWYEKSLINPEVITAQGIRVSRKYSGDYRDVITMYRPECRYVFEMGNSRMYRSWWNDDRWVEENSIQSNFNKGSGYSICSTTSIEEAIVGTPFQYSMWERFGSCDFVKIFDLYSRHPCIEYLAKLGMDKFVRAKLHDGYTYGAVNWNGKRIDQVLRLSKQRAKEFITFAPNASNMLTLRLFQIAIKERAEMNLQQINTLAERYSHLYTEMRKILKYCTLQRAVGYIDKQRKVERSVNRPDQLHEIVGTMRDYYADCERLGLNLSDDAVRFPSNLHRAHQNTIKQVKLKENQELNRKIAERRKALEKYSFQRNGLIIRAARDSKELIDEGKALSHCVGTYADRYAKGECDILVIRRAEAPEIPFYTMEIRKNVVYQCRGMKNCSMTDEVSAFVESFKKQRLEKKPIREKLKVRQEVAV